MKKILLLTVALMSAMMLPAQGVYQFWGMTQYGGDYDKGVIFKWDPETNVIKKKYDFNDSNGVRPWGNLLFSDGKLYGLTYAGGTYDKGVLFEWDPMKNIYTKKIDFDRVNGAYPRGSLTMYGTKFYGMTPSGGSYSADLGVIFEWDPVTNIYIKKIDFEYGPNGNGGRRPSGS